MYRVCLSVLLLATSMRAEESTKSLTNGGFEKDVTGKAPAEWVFPEECDKDGYSLAVSEEKPFAGKKCAVIRRTEKSKPDAFGNMIQAIDATSYRGKRVRFRAAVRADVNGDGNQAQLWLRVDRPGDKAGFFDNMGDRPVTAGEWKHYEIVGDVAEDAGAIVLGIFLLGNGTVAIDDVSLEVVDKSVRTTGRIEPAPGLSEVRMAATLQPAKGTTDATYLYPLPLSYRDQVPLTFRLSVDPPECAKSVEIIDGPDGNPVLKLSLTKLGGRKEVKVAYSAAVLTAPTSFDAVPKAAKFPKEWPAEAKPWLAATWCCDYQHEKVKALAAEVRGDSEDVMAVIRKALTLSQVRFANAKGRVKNLTAEEAIEKQGSCTSCANLVAALLRGAGVPARILAGYPLWSGPLQTHYIVEAYVPGYGWLPVESTMGKQPWPNHQQVNVSIVPPEHETEAKAKTRNNVAGGVPYLTLSELETPGAAVFSLGTLKPFCDHECRMVRPLTAEAKEWTAAMAWAKPRWAEWLKSKPELKNGLLTFGPNADEIKAGTPAALAAELR